MDSKAVKVTEALKLIDQVSFQKLVDQLIYEGAFSDLCMGHCVVNSNGVNIQKNRTVKSPGFPDTDIPSLDYAIEFSVDEQWEAKIKSDVEGKGNIKKDTWVFASSRDARDKKIKGGEFLSDYCKKKLNCNKIIILGIRNLLKALLDPAFQHIRRRYLEIDDDFFVSPETYLQWFSNKDNGLSEPQQKIEDGKINSISELITGKEADIIVISSKELGLLRYLLGLIAQANSQKLDKENSESAIIFIRSHMNNPEDKYKDEISSGNNLIVIWDNINPDEAGGYLKFLSKNNRLIFLCKDEISQGFIGALKDKRPDIKIEPVFVDFEIEEISETELTKHKDDISISMNQFGEWVLRYEALIYLFSPFSLDNKSARERIRAVLGIDEEKEKLLFDMMTQQKIIGKTHDLLWLNSPSTAKSLLDNYVDEGLINLEEVLL